METEINRRLSFLDITLNIKNNKIITDWYQNNIFWQILIILLEPSYLS